MKNITFSKLGLSLLLCALFQIAHAETNHNLTIVESITAGSAWYKAGKTQTIYFQPDFANTYVPKYKSDVLASGELFLGLQQKVSPALLTQFGLVVGTTSNAGLQGSIWETGDALFDNFNYQYDIRHLQVGIKTKLLTTHFSKIILPYLSVGLGCGFNKAYDFKTKPKLFEALPSPAFRAHTQTALTYTLGLGLQKSLSQHWHAGIGYEFSDWGKSALSPATGQGMGSGLSLNHLYTNQLQISLSHLS